MYFHYLFQLPTNQARLKKNYVSLSSASLISPARKRAVRRFGDTSHLPVLVTTDPQLLLGSHPAGPPQFQHSPREEAVCSQHLEMLDISM